MTISIIGTGYVGLVTGAVFADFGHEVFCIDIIEEKIDSLNKGIIPFYEPGLEEIVKRNLENNRLKFTTNYKESIPNSKVIFICVGTPPKENGEANLEYLNLAVTEASKHIKDFGLIVLKSTVPIGVEESLNSLLVKSSNAKIEFASCPEFLREGSALEDTIRPDRVVIGTNSKAASDLLLELYKHIGGQRIICGLRSAQMIKYAANTLLATKISFANAISLLCEETGANVEAVLKGVGLDHRIGPNFLSPGVGYGGSCFPKDLSAFVEIAKNEGYDFKLLKAVEEINLMQIDRFIKKLESEVGSLNEKTVALLGLAFKPDTDDMREAPSLKIIEKLLKAGAKIKAYDPVAIPTAQKILGEGKIEFANSAFEALDGADAMLVVTEWNEFKDIDLEKVKSLLKTPVIIDGRNIYDPEQVRNLGFSYQSFGRP